MAQHIKTAFTKPQDTKPYMPAKKVPGQTPDTPLPRTVNKTRKDDNRKAAVKQCKRYWGANHTHGGTRECDEYPFATTYEGAAEPDYDADAKKFNFSVKPIADPDNGVGSAGEDREDRTVERQEQRGLVVGSAENAWVRGLRDWQDDEPGRLPTLEAAWGARSTGR